MAYASHMNYSPMQVKSTALVDDLGREVARKDKFGCHRLPTFQRVKPNKRAVSELFKDAKRKEEMVGKADPIHGNIYTYWAFHEVLQQHGLIDPQASKSKVLQVGLLFVMIVQVLGPPAILIWSIYAINWSQAKIGLGSWQYQYGSYTHGISNFAGQILGTLFLFVFILNGIYVIRDDKKKSEKIWYVVKVLDGPDGRNRRNTVNKFWLRAGAIINSWCVVISAICMAPCFILSKSPKDIIFDAFALLFLFRLDDVNGDLGFLEEQWDSDLFGSFYEHIRDTEEIRKAESGENDDYAGVGSSGCSDDDELNELFSDWHCSVYYVARQFLMVLLVLVPLFYICVEGAVPRHILNRPDEHNASWSAMVSKLEEMSSQIMLLQSQVTNYHPAKLET
ncbi:unnamed protein product [Effrenium voratum]|nr:unnamed protein product [Effrenium voratum]